MRNFIQFDLCFAIFCLQKERVCGYEYEYECVRESERERERERINVLSNSGVE